MILIGRGLDQRFSRELSNLLLFSFEGISLIKRISGGHSEEVPPVPIPNTEVKLLSVDNTWRATAREDRTLPELSNGADKVNRLCPLTLHNTQKSVHTKSVTNANNKILIFLYSSVGRAHDC